MAPQPPGPGLPLQAPSVKISTVGNSLESIIFRVADRSVETHFLQIFARVLGPDQGTRLLVQPVIEPGQEKAKRAAAGQYRQGQPFGLAQGAARLIGLD